MIIYDTLMFTILKIIQFTGAFLFLTNNLSLNREDLIRDFSRGSSLITKKNNKIEYEEVAFRASYKKIWLNRISFVFIFVSLLADAFNIKVAESDYPLLVVLVITMTAYLLSYIVRKVVDVFIDKKEIPAITEKELKELGLSPDVEIITPKAIEKKIETKTQAIVDKNVEEIAKQIDKNVSKIVNKKVNEKVDKVVDKKVDEKLEEVKGTIQKEDKPKEFKMEKKDD